MLRIAPVCPLLQRAFDSELEHGNAFLFVPVFLAAGVLAYFSLSAEPGFAPLLLGAGAFAGLAAVTPARPAWRVLFLAGFFTIAGMLAAKVETWRADTQMMGSEISTRLTARVVRIEEQASGRVRLTLDLIATERPELRYAPQRLRATARSVHATLRPGDMVQGVVRLMPASGPVRPQSYDFAFRSYFDGLGAVGFFMIGPEKAEVAGPPSIWQRAEFLAQDLRGRMARRISERIGGGPEGEIAAALITGVRAGIPEEINEALRIVGLYHVISISGLHMALVGGTVMVALRCGFALFPSFSSRRPTRKYAALAALFATGFYLAISGGDVAAQRSFLMLAVMLIAVLFDRAALTMRNLAISAIIIILIAPHEVIGPSFQMSFAATAALVAAYAAWTRHREGRLSRQPPQRRSPLSLTLRAGVKYVAGMSMTSVVAGFATALFTAWHFQQVSPLGLVANLAAMPFVSVIVMPMAVLASVLMPFGLDGMPLALMGWGIGAMNAIAIWLAERSAFDSTGVIPLSAVLVLTAALAILSMAGSALRWAAAPLVVAGLALLAARELPDVLVSEDGRLVAMRLSNGSVAVNRARPRAFTMQNWLRAFDAGEVAGPKKTQDDPGGGSGEHGFACREGLCVARHASGAAIVHAADETAAAMACAYGDVIVIDDATARNLCAEDGVMVITKRDLARRGSAEIVLKTPAGGEWKPAAVPNMPGAATAHAAAEPDNTAAIKAGSEHEAAPGHAVAARIRFAIKEPYRPWHAHRRFSREARGLAPYQRPEQAED